MFELSQRQNVIYNICLPTVFSLSYINAANYGLKSLRSLSVKIWNIVSQDIIRSVSCLFQFISKFNSWIPDGCPSVYVAHTLTTGLRKLCQFSCDKYVKKQVMGNLFYCVFVGCAGCWWLFILTNCSLLYCLM